MAWFKRYGRFWWPLICLSTFLQGVSLVRMLLEFCYQVGAREMAVWKVYRIFFKLLSYVYIEMNGNHKIGRQRKLKTSVKLAHGSQFTVHGSLLTIHGSQFTVRSSRFAERERGGRRERERERQADRDREWGRERDRHKGENGERKS